MKNILYTICGLFLLAACTDKMEDDRIFDSPQDYEEIEITFGDTGLDITTRSFMDDVAVTEDWESRITALTIFIFNEEGTYVKMHSVSSSDLANKKTIIQMPREATGQYCTFYAKTGNSGPVNSNQYNAGERSFVENVYCNTDLKLFNGELDKMLSGEMYSSTLFPMSGSARVFVNPYGYLTEVFIPLKRLMAKVALEWRIDPDFSTNHKGGIVVLDNPYCIARNGGYVFEIEEPRDYNASSVAYKQTPGVWDGWNHNLWYIYEGKKNQFGNDKAITFTGIYDKDGDLNTTDDQHAVSYSVPIDYITDEQIVRRNTVYRIQVTITGLGENNLEATWAQEDWTVLPVHDYDTGL